MIPATINGQPTLATLSAMQKHIRRGQEEEAFHCAAEIALVSKAFFSMICNRLLLIAHEDIGLANPDAVVFTEAAVRAARELYDPKKPGKGLMPLGNAIRLMCRGPKSREGDHFLIAVAFRSLSGEAPELPDFAFDMHTPKGKRLGRGIEHFWAESAKLDNDATPNDPYKERAKRMIELRLAGGFKHEPGSRGTRLPGMEDEE